MPPRPESKESLRPYHSQIEEAIRNALSVALGGDVDPKDLVLDARDLQKIEEDIAADGEEAAGLNKGPKTRSSREKNISHFGQRPNSNNPGSETSTDSDIPVEMRPGGTNAAGSNGNDLENKNSEEDEDREDDDDAEEEDGERRPSKKSPTGEDPTEETTEGGVTKRKYRNGMESASWNGGINQDQGDGLKHCPVDGQILNQDGSCPAGDHNSLGSQPKQPGQRGTPGQPNQSRGPTTPGRPGNQRQPSQPAQGNQQAQNPQTQMPLIMRRILFGDENARQAAKKQIADLKQQITKEKAQITKLVKNSYMLDSTIQKVHASAALADITVVMFMIGLGLHVYAWHLSSEKGRIEKQIKKLKTSVKHKEQDIAKIARKNKVKA